MLDYDNYIIGVGYRKENCFYFIFNDNTKTKFDKTKKYIENFIEPRDAIVHKIVIMFTNKRAKEKGVLAGITFFSK